MSDKSSRIALILCASVLAIAALYFGRAVFSPAAMALFATAVVWPVQKQLETRLPQLAALAITLLLTILVVGALLVLCAWALSQIGRWMAINTTQLEALYSQVNSWLEGHGIFFLGVFVEKFEASWLVRPFRYLSSQARDLAQYSLLVLVFMMLALLEVRIFNEKLSSMERRDPGMRVSEACGRIVDKFRRYMAIRVVASALTGVTVWALSWLIGVDLPYAWGVLAFVLNFIPFIGPFFATVLPAAFAIAQFQSWEGPALILVGVSIIQFLIGSYLEPRLSGSALTMSPFLVVFSVFFAAMVWGIPGAFLGVPIAIAVLTFLEQNPATSWISDLLSGEPKAKGVG